MSRGTAWRGDHGRKTRASVGKQQALAKPPSLQCASRLPGATSSLKGCLARQPKAQSDAPPARVLQLSHLPGSMFCTLFSKSEGLLQLNSCGLSRTQLLVQPLRFGTQLLVQPLRFGSSRAQLFMQPQHKILEFRRRLSGCCGIASGVFGLELPLLLDEFRTGIRT